MLLSVLLIATSVSGSACFRAVPISLDQIRPNERVEVRVNDAAASRLTKELGIYALSLQGPVRQQRGDSVSVSVSIGREYSGVALENSRMDLYLARSEVTGFRRREFSRSRTTLLSVAAVAVFGAVVAAVVQTDNPNKPEDTTPPPPPPLGNRFGFRIAFP